MSVRIKILLFFLLLTAKSLFAQNDLTAATITQINDNLLAHRYEFSALAKWKDKILLVPQNRKNVVDTIFFIDSAEIDQSIQTNKLAVYTGYKINSLTHAGAKKDSLFIDNILLSNYDGFEAAVVSNDSIYFSLETDTTFCYLIKGIINEKKKSIDILPDTLHIPNTYAINNAGYESLSLLPGKNSLLAFFECNKDTVAARAFMCSTNLKSKIEPLLFSNPLYFRLTDTYALNDSVLIGINHLFIKKRYALERDNYIRCINLSSVEKQLTNGGNIDTCYTSIIQLNIHSNKINWKPLFFISLDDRDNYEGIVPFKNGVLLVVDGEPGLNPCKLVYAINN